MFAFLEQYHSGSYRIFLQKTLYLSFCIPHWSTVRYTFQLYFPTDEIVADEQHGMPNFGWGTGGRGEGRFLCAPLRQQGAHSLVRM